eukprot:1633420-Heterocapsa_arctica.AAC.1
MRACTSGGSPLGMRRSRVEAKPIARFCKPLAFATWAAQSSRGSGPSGQSTARPRARRSCT